MTQSYSSFRSTERLHLRKRCAAEIPEALLLEGDLLANDSSFVTCGSGLEILRGHRPVIVIAPHATVHPRAGRLKYAEIGTASLARLIHRLSGAHAIYPTRRSLVDPAFTEKSVLKSTLDTLLPEIRPSILIDLHALSPLRIQDIDLGSMWGASVGAQQKFVAALLNELHRAGLTHISMNRLPATRPSTITRWATSVGVPCIQCEVHSRWLLQPQCDDLQKQRFIQLASAIVSCISTWIPRVAQPLSERHLRSKELIREESLHVTVISDLYQNQQSNEHVGRR